MASIETLATQLSELLDGARIDDLGRLSGGASRDTFRFSADGRQLVLQRQRPGATNDMGLEAAVVRAARLAGVDVAEVVAASTDHAALGAPYLIMEAVAGETIARKILRDDDFAVARQRLTGQWAQALARLHAMPDDGLTGLVASDPLAQWRDTLDVLGQPHPTFELALRWLDAHRPPPRSPVVVHGDFRLGNMIIGPDGLRAVIDWELAHLGDPAEDLGWLCVKAWRFGSRLPVAGVGEYDPLLGAYAAAGGSNIDRETLRWWEVLGTLKWGVMCILQTTAHLSGMSRSHELAAIGRRVCENEHDLFLVLQGAW